MGRKKIHNENKKGDSSINGLSPFFILDELADEMDALKKLTGVPVPPPINKPQEQSDPEVSSAIDEQIKKLRDRGVIQDDT